MGDAPKLAPVIVRLTSAASAELAAIELECNSPPWSQKLFADETLNAHSRMYGARVSGLIVGYLVARVVGDEAHIVNVGVRRVVRSRGIGRTLLMHVLRDFHAQAVMWVALEVRRSNAVAQQLYRSLGFVEMGERAAYYADNKEDALLMTLNVPQFIAQWGSEEPVEGVRSAA
jgi:[ribosomal protein S18]-alanine N-acetyltransferase